VVCGFKVRQSGAIVLSPLILHRQPDYWERADDFHHARWAGLVADKRRPELPTSRSGAGRASASATPSS